VNESSRTHQLDDARNYFRRKLMTAFPGHVIAGLNPLSPRSARDVICHHAAFAGVMVIRPKEWLLFGAFNGKFRREF